MRFYVFLILAIVMECSGTYFVKLSEGFSRLWPTLACLGFYAVSFFMFSKALLGIPLSVAYATWGALGIVLATLISALLFHESLNTMAVIGVVICITGVVLVNLSISH